MTPSMRCLLTITCVMLGHAAFADSMTPPLPMLEGAANGADYAASVARDSTGGRVLDVQPLSLDQGRESFEVRVLLQEGRVRRVRVDAADPNAAISQGE